MDNREPIPKLKSQILTEQTLPKMEVFQVGKLTVTKKPISKNIDSDASIYTAFDEGLNKEVALKVFDMSLPRYDGDTRRELTIGERVAEIHAEVEAMNRAHKSTIAYAVIEAEDFPDELKRGPKTDNPVYMIVMDYKSRAEFSNLKDLISPGYINYTQNIALTRLLFHELEENKKRGIVHRDIRKDNILVRSLPEIETEPQDEAKLEVVIMDWGLSSAAKPNLGPDVMVGASAKAPEAYIDGSDTETFKSDLYSMCALAAEMYMGESYYKLIAASNITRAHIIWANNDGLNPLARKKLYDIYGENEDTNKLADILDRGLKKDPAMRPEDPEKFGNELANAYEIVLRRMRGSESITDEHDTVESTQAA